MAKRGGIIEWRQREFMAEVSGQLANNMLSACEFVAGEAQARAPKRTGTLASEIDVAVEVTASGHEITGWVGVKKGRGFYGFFQEVGTARHPAHPFLRPSVFGNGRRIVEIVSGEISVSGGFRRGTSRRGRGSKAFKRLKFKPRIPRLKVPRIPRLKLPKVRRPTLPKPPKLHIPRF